MVIEMDQWEMGAWPVSSSIALTSRLVGSFNPLKQDKGLNTKLLEF